jgi:hypothetical protein
MLQGVQERRGGLDKQSRQQEHRNNDGILLDLLRELTPGTHAWLLPKRVAAIW